MDSSSDQAHHTATSTAVVGLSNLGNTCFFNSSLQLLLACAPLQQLLLQPDHHISKGPLGYALQQAALFVQGRWQRPSGVHASMQLQLLAEPATARASRPCVHSQCALACARKQCLHMAQELAAHLAVKQCAAELHTSYRCCNAAQISKPVHQLHNTPSRCIVLSAIQQLPLMAVCALCYWQRPVAAMAAVACTAAFKLGRSWADKAVFGS